MHSGKMSVGNSKNNYCSPEQPDSYYYHTISERAEGTRVQLDSGSNTNSSAISHPRAASSRDVKFYSFFFKKVNYFKQLHDKSLTDGSASRHRFLFIYSYYYYCFYY